MYCALFNLKYIQSTEGGVVPSWVCIKILPKRVLLHEPACSKENELKLQIVLKCRVTTVPQISCIHFVDLLMCDTGHVYKAQ